MPNPITVETNLTARRMDSSTYRFPVLVTAEVTEDGRAALVNVKLATTKDDICLTLEQQEHVEDAVLRTWNQMREDELRSLHEATVRAELEHDQLECCRSASHVA
jgi:hypothetical protein